VEVINGHEDRRASKDDRNTEERSMNSVVDTVKVKPWAMIELKNQRDPEYLVAMVKAYESAYDDPSSNKDYVKIKSTITKLHDDAKKEVARLERAKASGDWGSMTDENKMRFVCEMLDPKYRKGFGRDGTSQMLKIVNAAEKIVAIVDSKQAIHDQVQSTIAATLKDRKQILAPRHVSELADFWKLYGEDIPTNFETYAGFDRETWCLGRSKHLPKDGPMPTWTNLMARMNDPKAFAAWVYGVVSKQYAGRQILWLHGENGEDGKSFIQKIIAEQCFANVFAALNNNALGEGSSRFLQADFEGKALAFWDDCNNQMALFREDIKQLSSGKEGNPARIEKKTKQAYTSQLETRMWINSNFAPVVSSDVYTRSRLLYIHIEPLNEAPDVTLKAKFVAEMPALLAYGKKCFDEVCVDGRAINQNAEANDAIDQFVTDHESAYEAIFRRSFFVVKEGKPVLASDVANVLQAAGLKSNIDKGHWYTWLERRHGFKRTAVKEGKSKVQVIEGLKVKPAF
jgi:hypothetical protein